MTSRYFLGFANTLTLLRILLIPSFVVAFYFPNAHFPIATILFTLAAITDFLDGYLARYLQEVSILGKFLDPVADKLLVISALILLISERSHATWFTLASIITICREVSVSSLREWSVLINRNMRIPSSKVAKIKTSVQMIAIILLLTDVKHYHIEIHQMGYILFGISTVLAVFSMGNYIHHFWGKLKSTYLF